MFVLGELEPQHLRETAAVCRIGSQLPSSSSSSTQTPTTAKPDEARRTNTLSAPINLLLLQRDINGGPQTSEESVAVHSLEGRT